ncbi:hypothetical protein [Polaromonas hydrogenivorans]|uniref:Uncharacterized protein n=1 Tax=Polaromonas hydrogenivorans TaxID=335476 RepID=A0AAU7LZZ1_9BURK
MAKIIYLPARQANRIATMPAAAPFASGGLDPVQLHAQAHNALAMAVHYLNQPQANVPGAARKAVQALSALRRLDVASCM